MACRTTYPHMRQMCYMHLFCSLWVFRDLSHFIFFWKKSNPHVFTSECNSRMCFCFRSMVKCTEKYQMNLFSLSVFFFFLHFSLKTLRYNNNKNTSMLVISMSSKSRQAKNLRGSNFWDFSDRLTCRWLLLVASTHPQHLPHARAELKAKAKMDTSDAFPCSAWIKRNLVRISWFCHTATYLGFGYCWHPRVTFFLLAKKV